MNTIQPPHSPDYRPDIDGLRAVAVLLVVCYHAVPTLVTGGFIGVDIFFVISGYLITGLILNAMRAGSFSLADFYARRCRRILPALFAMLLVVWGLGWLVLLPAEFRDLGREMLAGIAFSENMLLAHEAGYFDVEAARKPLLHLWSLAIEEQFYLFWPLLLLLARRVRVGVQLLSGVLLAASFAFAVYVSHANPLAAFYLLPSRFWEILLGACLFHWESRGVAPSPRCNEVKSVVALALLLVFAFLFYALLLDEEKGAALAWVAMPCLAAALLISAGPGAWFNRRILSAPLLVWGGRISYPLYLWHWPLLSLAYVVEDERPALSIRLGAVALALVLSWATYRWVERPVRTRGRVTLRGALGGAVLLGGLGFFAATGTGVPGTPWGANMLRFADMDRANMDTILDRQWWKNHEVEDESCLSSGWNTSGGAVNYCRLTAPVPRVALLGDSHANHLVPGLVGLKDTDFSALVEVNYGCNALAGNPRQLSACALTSEGFFDKVRVEKAIRYVIISIFMYGTPEATLSDGLHRTIESFERSGKQIIFFMDVPSLGFDPMRCLNVRRFSMTSRDRMLCAKPKAQVLAEQAPMRALVEELKQQHPKMRTFDPIPALCDDEYCYAIRDKKMLYRDGDHLSPEGSARVARAFKEAWPKR